MLFAIFGIALTVSCSNSIHTVYYKNDENHSIIEIDKEQNLLYYWLCGGDTRSRICTLDMIAMNDTTYLLKIRPDAPAINLKQDTLNNGIRRNTLVCFVKEDTLTFIKKSEKLTIQLLNGQKTYHLIK